MSKRTAVVMAAGKGTRMKSELPKVLFPVLGRPMVEYVIDTLDAAGIDRIILVVGYRSDLVRETLAHRKNLDYVEQTEQLGTGHAVMMAREKLENYDGPVMVVAGDCPMIQLESIEKMFAAYDSAATDEIPACILGTAYKDDPVGLGRIVRNPEGDFVGIVEEKDATSEQKGIKEVNMSYYLFRGPDLLDSLGHLKTDNSQKEYYITDTPAVLIDLGRKVAALPVLKPIESLGINTVEELEIVEKAMSL